MNISMLGALQLHVVNPKRFAVPAYGQALPAIDPDASLDHKVTIWNRSLQCLWDDVNTGGRVLADALGDAWDDHVEYLDGGIAFGGWKEDACAVLLIYLHRTCMTNGSVLDRLNQETATTFANWLLHATDADCVAASNFLKGLRIEVKPGSEAIHASVGGEDGNA